VDKSCSCCPLFTNLRQAWLSLLALLRTRYTHQAFNGTVVSVDSLYGHGALKSWYLAIMLHQYVCCCVACLRGFPSQLVRAHVRLPERLPARREEDEKGRGGKNAGWRGTYWGWRIGRPFKWIGGCRRVAKTKEGRGNGKLAARWEIMDGSGGGGGAAWGRGIREEACVFEAACVWTCVIRTLISWCERGAYAIVLACWTGE